VNNGEKKRGGVAYPYVGGGEKSDRGKSLTTGRLQQSTNCQTALGKKGNGRGEGNMPFALGGGWGGGVFLWGGGGGGEGGGGGG